MGGAQESVNESLPVNVSGEREGGATFTFKKKTVSQLFLGDAERPLVTLPAPSPSTPAGKRPFQFRGDGGA